MSRAREVVSACLVSLLVTGIGATCSRRAPRAVFAEGDTRSAHDEEVAIARSAGLTVVDDGDTHPSSVSLAEGECVALVGSLVVGADRLRAAIQVGSDRDVQSGPVVHVATCVARAGTVGLATSLETDEWGGDDRGWRPPETRARWTLLRGEVDDPASYARLALDASTVAQLAIRRTRRHVEAVAHFPRALGDWAVATREHAVVVPPSRATWGAARALTGRRATRPRLDTDTGDPFASAADRVIGPHVLGQRGLVRLVAVVDAGALGAPCAAVTIASPAAADLGSMVRVAVPEGTVTRLWPEDGVVIERFCPATGLFAYMVVESAAPDYQLRAWALDAPSDAVASASTFAATDLVIPVPGLVTRARDDCARVDDGACLRLAALGAEEIEGASPVADVLETACSARGGVACDLLSRSVTSARDADRLERRACETGWGAACTRRGLRSLTRAGAPDLASAWSTFGFGCEHGADDSCTARRTMETWQLVPDPPTSSVVR